VFVKLWVRTEGFPAGCSLLFGPSDDHPWVQLKYALLHVKGLEEDGSVLGQNTA